VPGPCRPGVMDHRRAAGAGAGGFGRTGRLTWPVRHALEVQMRVLIAIPVYNEQRYVQQVLERVLAHAPDVLVIDDGSTDATPLLLSQFPVEVIRHARNRGYGRSLMDAFRCARHG
jgi:cellulose synthase/poly-beta-1,6-N-acetylglucosamine synthase-like glycosyltransferase